MPDFCLKAVKPSSVHLQARGCIPFLLSTSKAIVVFVLYYHCLPYPVWLSTVATVRLRSKVLCGQCE
uniref:Uncharacterized protein n=1 Tax=Romanomermis culicivorax TaxID=13658 RepID=A0A915HQ72_ROMCU